MRSLVLSGGGSKGAFQVGVLDALTKMGNGGYDMFCGVSVGAVNGAFLSMYKDIAFRNGVEALRELWDGLTTKKIYKRHFPLGMIHGLWTPSLFDSSPFSEMVHEVYKPEMTQKFGHKLLVGAVSTQTGEYAVFDETYPEISKAIVASAAFPLVFTPVDLGEDDPWVDGGVINATPLQAALDMGATEIDVILTEHIETKPFDGAPKNVIELGMRVIGFMAKEIFENDIQLAREHGIEPRIIRPTEHFDVDPMNFEQEGIQKMMKHGYDLAMSL